MKKIVIFGATGNVGIYFTMYCQKFIDASEYEIIAVGRKRTGYFSENDINYVNVDIRNECDFDSLPQKDVYAVVNLAGMLPAYTSEYNPYMYIDTNVTGGVMVTEYAKKAGADRIIYTQTWSDQAGYWGKREVLSPDLPRKLAYTGDHAFYAITKSMMVDTLQYYQKEYGLKCFIFRLPNVYLYSPEMFYYVDCVKKYIGYRYMIERISNGEDVEMWGDPQAFKDILYVKDLCQMMYKALFAGCDGGTYNAGTGIRTSLKEQIEGIIEVFAPCPEKVNIIPRPEKASFTSFVMDIDNARRDLGYEPQYTYMKYLEDYKIERENNRFKALWTK